MLAIQSLRPSLLIAARISRCNSTAAPNLRENAPNGLSPDAETNSAPPSPPSNSYPPPINLNPITTITRRPPKYRLYVHSTRNNTITTLTRPDGSPLAWFSGGSCGFKKGNRASYEAGYQCAVRMFKRVEDEVDSGGRMELDIFFRGFGQGRDALHRALLTSEGEKIRHLVTSVTDRTAIKIGGTRAPKARRL